MGRHRPQQKMPTLETASYALKQATLLMDRWHVQCAAYMRHKSLDVSSKGSLGWGTWVKHRVPHPAGKHRPKRGQL